MQKAGAERMQKKKKDITQVLWADIHLSGLTEHRLVRGYQLESAAEMYSVDVN